MTPDEKQAKTLAALYEFHKKLGVLLTNLDKLLKALHTEPEPAKPKSARRKSKHIKLAVDNTRIGKRTTKR